MVPPDELKGILKTIAHNFISDRCSEEQMAVGINASRAICTRVPSLLGDDEETTNGETGGVSMDMEAFARDLAAYNRHRDKSVQIAAKAWLNFVRETHPALLQGKDRGLVGTGMLKTGEKPIKYGQSKASVGVEGAELLLAYEENRRLKKEQRRALKRKLGEDEEGEEGSGSGSGSGSESESCEDSWEEEEMSDDGESGDEGDWQDVSGGESGEGEGEGEGEEEEEEEEEKEEEEEEEEGKKKSKTKTEEEVNWDEYETDDSDNSDADSDADSDDWICVSGDEKDEGKKKKVLSKEEKEKLRAEVSSTRVFSSADFLRMKKLASREAAEMRDPRAAARRKKAVARGEAFADMSEDEGYSSDENTKTYVKGAIEPSQIMAEATKRKHSKLDRLQTILDGRTKFEQVERGGGTTNTEKLRKKTFAMQQHSYKNRTKGRDDKQTKKNGAGMRGKVKQQGKLGKEKNHAKRRRRT